MTVREERRVAGPPSMTLAAVATAGENIGFTVRGLRRDAGLVLMTSPLTLEGATLGYIVTARVREASKGSHLSIDVTPRLGSWGASAAEDALRRLVQEFQVVLEAPKARIRRPELGEAGPRPFGYRPEILAASWALLGLLVFGVGFGSWGWLMAGAAVVGAALHAEPRTDAWWSWTVTGLALLSLPFGGLGALARRLALANLYWQDTADS